MLKTAGEAVTFSCWLPHIDTPVLVDQQRLRSICSVWTLDAVYQKWWLIGMVGKRETRELMLSAQLDCLLRIIVSYLKLYKCVEENDYY